MLSRIIRIVISCLHKMTFDFVVILLRGCRSERRNKKRRRTTSGDRRSFFLLESKTEENFLLGSKDASDSTQCRERPRTVTQILFHLAYLFVLACRIARGTHGCTASNLYSMRKANGCRDETLPPTPPSTPTSQSLSLSFSPALSPFSQK